MNLLKLSSIEAKLYNPNISLKEIKTLWFEAKGIIKNISDGSYRELEVSVNIFNLGAERVSNFFTSWIIENKIRPTDEELDLLEEAFDEASWALNFLATNPPYVVSSDDNEVAQKQIKSSKQIVKEEKSKRKQTKDLQKQIDVLQNQSNNERKVKDLKKKISDLENRKPNFSSLSGLNFPKRSVSSGNDRNYSPKSFCLGFGVCIVLLLIIFFAKKVFNSLN